MKVVTFGEIMMRLASPRRLRFAQSKELELTFGGAESNVAISLANYGMEARFISRLPNNPFGDMAISQLRGLGVDTSMVARGGDRIGIYFLETGASQRPSQVVYDRAGSAMSQLEPEQIDWRAAFAGASWFHFTGITPALGPSVAAATLEACRIAKELGLTVSCDLNYRAKLWTLEEAKPVLSSLMEFVDVVIGNEEHVRLIFGIEAPNLEEVAKEFAAQFGLSSVAMTQREGSSADENRLGAMLFHEGQVFHSRFYDIHMVDRVGGGDALTGGLIYSLVSGEDTQSAIEFAVAAACLKHSIIGDYNLVSRAEVEALMQGGGAGRVQR